MTTQRRFARRLELLDLALGLAGALLLWPLAGGHIASSFGAGALLGAADLAATAHLTLRVTEGSLSSRHIAVALLLVRLAFVATGLWVALTQIGLDPLALLAGLSLSPAVVLVLSALDRSPLALDGRRSEVG
jgi:hypothetical protein